MAPEKSQGICRAEKENSIFFLSRILSFHVKIFNCLRIPDVKQLE